MARAKQKEIEIAEPNPSAVNIAPPVLAPDPSCALQTPIVTAQDLMAEFANHRINLIQQRLRILAQKYPELRTFLKKG